MIKMNSKKTTLKINMHCEGCSVRISNTLSGINGILGVYPDLNNHKITISYDERTIDLEKIKETIRGMGYMVG
jgi:copper chaperone CopZ